LHTLLLIFGSFWQLDLRDGQMTGLLDILGLIQCTGFVAGAGLGVFGFGLSIIFRFTFPGLY
jgi:hypothetical protein